MNNSTRNYRIGDVYLMKFSGDGSEQNGWRPGVVFQNNVGNHYSPNIIALPFTTSIKKVSQPTHVVIRKSKSGLDKDSMCLCENPERMSKKKIGRYLTTISYDDMSRIAAASLLATSAISFIDADTLMGIHEKAILLNATIVA